MNYLETNISVYKGVKDTTGTTAPITNILAKIKGNEALKKSIEKLRTLEGKEKDSYKQALPAVTWSGTFEKRNAKKLIQYSGLICLDFDKIENVSETLYIPLPDFVLCMFVSPSGNGLKIICAVTGGEEKHKDNFAALTKYFQTSFSITADESGKDVSRLCFLSADVNIYVNPDCTPYELPAPDQPKQKPTNDKKPQKRGGTPRTHPTGAQTLESLVAFTEKKQAYTQGNRNNFIHLFACNANRAGISEAETLQFVQTNFDIAHENPDEVKATVESAYKQNIAEHGTRAPGARQTQTIAALNKTSEAVNDKIVFWYWVDSKESDKETGEIKQVPKFSYRAIRQFLTNNGFFRYEINGAYELVRVTGYLIDFVTEVQIRDFIYTYLEARPELAEVDEMVTRAMNRYLSSSIFERLPYVNYLNQNEN